MKLLNLNELEKIQGGGNWVSGFCAGVSISLIIAPNPVSGVLGAGCIGYGIGEAFDLW